MANERNENRGTRKKLLEFIQSNASQELAEEFINYIKSLEKDSLTKTFTRRVFEEILAKELASSFRTKKPLSFSLTDVDDLKPINDKYGHFYGDKFIQTISESIKAMLRRSDIVGRIGGDEFGIVLPDTNKFKGYLAIEKIRKSIKVIDKYNTPITHSISSGITSTEDIGLEIIYGERGRDLIKARCDSSSDESEWFKKWLNIYCEKAGKDEKEIRNIVKNIYDFLIHIKGIDIDKDHEKVAIDMLEFYAGKALQIAKKTKNSVYVFDSTKGIGQYAKDGLWIPYTKI